MNKENFNYCLRGNQQTNRLNCHAQDLIFQNSFCFLILQAIQTGNLRAISSILKEDPKLVNNPRYSGFPPIHYACTVGNVMALKELLDHGANVSIVS